MSTSLLVASSTLSLCGWGPGEIVEVRLSNLLAALFTVEMTMMILPFLLRARMTCRVMCPTSLVLVIEELLNPRMMCIDGILRSGKWDHRVMDIVVELCALVGGLKFRS